MTTKIRLRDSDAHAELVCGEAVMACEDNMEFMILRQGRNTPAVPLVLIGVAP